MVTRVFRSRVARRIFLSYVAVLLIVLISIGMINYYWVINTLKKNEQDACVNTLVNVDERVRSVFQSLDAFTEALSKTHWLRNIALTNGKEINYDRISPLEIANSIKELNVYNSLNASISKVAIFLNEKEKVMTASSFDSAEWFFRYTNHFTKMQADHWIGMMNGLTSVNDRVICGPYDVENYWTNTRSFVYLSVIPVSEYTTKATLFVMIDEKSIQKLLADALIQPDAGIYIADGQNQIVTRIDSAPKIDGASPAALRQPAGEALQLSDEPYFTFTHQSANLPVRWTYVMTVPVRSVMGGVNNIKILLFFLYSILFLLGIFICYKATLYNYKPINSIANLLKTDATSPSYVRNEYNTIESAIKNIYDREEAARETIEKYAYAAAIEILFQVVNNEHIGSSDDELKARIATVVDNPLFAVAVFDRAAFSGRPISEYLADPFWTIHSKVQNRQVISVINAYSPTQIDNAVKCMIGLHDTEAAAGVGSVGDLTILHQSSQEAAVACEYMTLKNQVGVLYFHDLPMDADKVYRYPRFDFDRLADMLSNREFPDKRALLNSTLKQLISESNPSLSIERYLFYKLAAVCLEKASDRQIADFLKQGDGQSAQSNSQERIEGLLKQICSVQKDRSAKDSNENLINHILQYIEEHYTETQMSLNLLSDTFDVSSSKICSLFKEHVGEKYHDYVSRMRIRTAKTLLAETDLTVEEVGLHVGYDNPTTFRRVFKKYENQPPSRFKSTPG